MTTATPRYAADALRPDLARIASWIEPGSRVLDLVAATARCWRTCATTARCAAPASSWTTPA